VVVGLAWLTFRADPVQQLAVGSALAVAAGMVLHALWRG
jgi:hypothetical protein